MNHLAFFALAITGLQAREVDRQIDLRRKRVGDDDAPTRIRDRQWAAAIRRAATGGVRLSAEGVRHNGDRLMSHREVDRGRDEAQPGSLAVQRLRKFALGRLGDRHARTQGC
jgi:hypothetical protein